MGGGWGKKGSVRTLGIGFRFGRGNKFARAKLGSTVVGGLTRVNLSLLSFGCRGSNCAMASSLLPVGMICDIYRYLVRCGSFNPLPSCRVVLNNVRAVPRRCPCFSVRNVSAPSIIRVG